MDKPIACIECSSSGVKLLVGYCLSGTPYCVYRSFTKLEDAWKDGIITDPDSYLKALSAYRAIDDQKALVRISVTEASIVLPSLGLKVYEGENETFTTSQNNEISKLDITNVLGLFSKQSVPDELKMVDIVPDQYILEDNSVYTEPPFGKVSKTVLMKAKIHAIPTSIYELHDRLAQHAGYRVSNRCVSAYANAAWIATLPEMPSSYLLVDMGAKTTTISLIGNNSPFDSRSFYLGGDHLTERIAESLRLDKALAESLKVRFGYDERELSYNPSFAEFAGPGFEKCDAHQKDLNEVIVKFYEEWEKHLARALDEMLAKYRDVRDSLPFVITGGASALHGIKRFLERALPGKTIHYAHSRTIGCLDDGFGPLLGMLCIASKYRGSLNDSHQGMATVSRVPTKKAKAPKPSPEEDNL